MSKKIRTEAVDYLFSAILSLENKEECYTCLLYTSHYHNGCERCGKYPLFHKIPPVTIRSLILYEKKQNWCI